MSEKIIAGVDVWYGAVKACVLDEQNERNTTYFPRFLAEDETTHFEELRGLTAYGINGKRYLIGNDALLYPENITRDEAKDYINHEEYWLCIGKALHDTGIFDQGDSVRIDRLVLGVAPGHYTQEIRQSMKARAGKGVDFVVKNKTYRFTVENTHILPQGAGAYFRHVMNDHGKLKNPDDYKYLYGICDVGFRTSDFVLFEQGRFLGGKELSEDTGIRIVLESLQEYVRKKYDNYNCHVGLLTDVLQGKPLVYKGQDIDLGEVKTKMLTDLTGRIEKAVQKRWEDRLNRMKNIILCGGGAYHFADAVFLAGHKSQIHIPEQPEFSNAIGFFRYGMMEQAKDARK